MRAMHRGGIPRHQALTEQPPPYSNYLSPNCAHVKRKLSKVRFWRGSTKCLSVDHFWDRVYGLGAQATSAHQIAAIDVPSQPVHNNQLSSVRWSPVLGTMPRSEEHTSELQSPVHL